MKFIEEEGKTTEEAIEQALKKLGLPREKVKIEILGEEKKGLFGLGSRRPAKVKVSINPEDEARAAGYHFLRELLEKIQIAAEVYSSPGEEDRSMQLEIISQETALLIGRNGRTLDALQYIVNLVANKGMVVDKRWRIIIDAEKYRQRRKEAITALARRLAEEVKGKGKKISMEPMSAQERKIVHLVFKDDPQIMTASIGEGEKRRVVIKKTGTENPPNSPFIKGG